MSVNIVYAKYMPRRQEPLVTEEVYHVFNRGIDRRPTFTDKREYQRAINIMQFYRFASPTMKLSRYLSLQADIKSQFMQKMEKENQCLVEIHAFALMPNHFHFLLKQKVENVISRFMSQFQNSYVRYFNTKHERQGQLFLVQFKAVRIETEEQFVHVSRYIHLNPLTSYVIKTLEQLLVYPWTSLPDYFEKDHSSFCEIADILAYVNGKDNYKKFVSDQVDYQRELDKIKHLTFDK